MSSQVRFCKTTDSRSKLDSSSCCLFRLNFPFLYFHDAALITFRFRRSVRFRKTSWSRLKHFFWSPRSQTETVWPSTKHACCVGRSLYKKTPSLWPLKQLEMSPGVLKKITTTVPLCLPLQQVANEHIKVKVLCHVGYTFGLQTC